MPGILPMKVIKVGGSTQPRIAQACDRCRSKKIRCDGVRPCCSQCANVGFECKTSDKLSRRAFPRGYTESLEERVRGLESEVRELKDLLDAKDEKLDLLSRLHSQSPHAAHSLSSRRQSSTSTDSKDGKESTFDKDDVITIQQSPYLLDGDGSDAYFSGTSSGRTFIEAFKNKVQEKDHAINEFDTDKLLASSHKSPLDGSTTPPSDVTWNSPPRMISDKLVTVFFQEWSPLFPVLHRPSFLELYERYASDSTTITDRAEMAQLNLVFGIATLSGGTRSSEDLDSFEMQWKAALDSVLIDNTMSTLQALILAQLYCMQRCDLTRLLTYKGLSTSLSARLGLHRSQKRFALDALACETRKKVFWALYAVDCFTAASLGLPKHLKDEDIQCEYPVDADDEYITEHGSEPSLPGESTKLSSALAIFRLSRILSRVLNEIFPAKATYDISLKKLSDLVDELDVWSSSLAPQLRLEFSLDKPSTGTTSSRSPLLSLTYHYIRALIHRPAVTASLGRRAGSFMLAMASSCKHMIQIIQLLDERGLCFSMCLNREEVLVLSGIGLLFQGLDLEPDSKILKDNDKMLNAALNTLEISMAPCATLFSEVARSLRPSLVPWQPKKDSVHSLSRHQSSTATSEASGSSTLAITNSSLQDSPKKHFKIKPLCLSASPPPARPSTEGIGSPPASHINKLQSHIPPVDGVSALQIETPQKTSSEPPRSPAMMLSRTRSPDTTRPSAPPHLGKPRRPRHQLTNLDYLSFGHEPETPASQSSASAAEPVKPDPGPTAWERLLGNLDNGTTNIYDATYGGQPVAVLLDVPPLRGSDAIIASSRRRSSTNSRANANDSTKSASCDVAELWALGLSDSAGSVQVDSVSPPSLKDRSSRLGSADYGSIEGSVRIPIFAESSCVTASDQLRAVTVLDLGSSVEDDVDFEQLWDASMSL